MQRETYSVEITTFRPIRSVGIATYIHVPGNPPMQRGGGTGWRTCGHQHKTYEAAVACGRKINARAGVENDCEFA